MQIIRYIDGKKHKNKEVSGYVSGHSIRSLTRSYIPFFIFQVCIDLLQFLRNSFIAHKNVAKAPQLETNSNYNIELDRSIQSESPRLIRIHCRIGHGNDHM